MLERARGISQNAMCSICSIMDQNGITFAEEFVERETYLTIKQLRVSVLNKTRWYWNIFCLGCESVHEDGDCFCHD